MSEGLVFWIADDAEGEPTVWIGEGDYPLAILRRCEIAASESIRDELLRRIAGAES